jgi:Ca2+-binding EF-hand superfamily protein
MAQHGAPGASNDRLRAVFEGFDEDKDFKISRDEFRQAVRRLIGSLTLDDIDCLWLVMDLESHESLSVSDFQTFLHMHTEDQVKRGWY